MPPGLIRGLLIIFVGFMIYATTGSTIGGIIVGLIGLWFVYMAWTHR